MFQSRHQYALDFHRADGQRVGTTRIEPNWEPACEWTRFSAERRGLLPDGVLEVRSLVEPIPQSERGLPFTTGFRIVLLNGEHRVEIREFPVTYFNQVARDHASSLVKKNVLESGERFSFRLMAYPISAVNRAGTSRADAMQVTETFTPTTCRPADLGELSARATPFGEELAGDVPVFIPQQVLEEATALTQSAGAVETGGILIGHLCHDRGIPDIGSVVSAQIPAKHTEGSLNNLTFTPDTWAAVRSAIKLRGRGEIFLGWWHSHPAKHWCNPKCPPEARRVCPMAKNFFSEDDLHLHETVFPKAYQTALVITNTDEGLKQALFAWREGVVTQRGFRIIPNERPFIAVEAQQHGEPVHETPCPT